MFLKNETSIENKGGQQVIVSVTTDQHYFSTAKHTNRSSKQPNHSLYRLLYVPVCRHCESIGFGMKLKSITDYLPSEGRIGRLSICINGIVLSILWLPLWFATMVATMVATCARKTPNVQII